MKELLFTMATKHPDENTVCQETIRCVCVCVFTIYMALYFHESTIYGWRPHNTQSEHASGDTRYARVPRRPYNVIWFWVWAAESVVSLTIFHFRPFVGWWHIHSYFFSWAFSRFSLLFLSLLFIHSYSVPYSVCKVLFIIFSISSSGRHSIFLSLSHNSMVVVCCESLFGLVIGYISEFCSLSTPFIFVDSAYRDEFEWRE